MAITLTFTLALCREIAQVYHQKGEALAAIHFQRKAFPGDASIDTETARMIARKMASREWPEAAGMASIQLEVVEDGR